MRQLGGVGVVVAVLAIGGVVGALLVACGGPPKPPMVPDDNSDGGTVDTPSVTPPAPSIPGFLPSSVIRIGPIHGRDFLCAKVTLPWLTP